MRDEFLHPASEANSCLLSRSGDLLKDLFVRARHEKVLSIDTLFHPEELQTLLLNFSAHERTPHLRHLQDRTSLLLRLRLLIVKIQLLYCLFKEIIQALLRI